MGDGCLSARITWTKQKPTNSSLSSKSRTAPTRYDGLDHTCFVLGYFCNPPGDGGEVKLNAFATGDPFGGQKSLGLVYREGFRGP